MAQRSSISWQLLLALAVVIGLDSGSMNASAQSTSTNGPSSTPSSAPSSAPTSTVSMTSTRSTTGSTTMATPGPTPPLLYIIIGTVIGVVMIIIGATIIILCVAVSMRKKCKRRASVDLTLSKKSPNRDGYINALYEMGTQGIDTGDLVTDQNGKPMKVPDVDSDIAKKSVRLSDTSKISKTSHASKASKTSKTNGSDSTVNYDYASDGTTSPGSRSQCSLPSDANVREKERATVREKERSKREGSYEYAYATTSVDRISSSTSSSSVRSPQKRGFSGSICKHSIRKENEMLIYIAPAMDENSLYAQFAEIRVKCLARDTIKITEMIGSGQFGKVHQGEWTAPGSNDKVDVAVKTLKEGAGEQDKVKFLQEAAIMGQFSHPNVVKLYGVVTIGEPVMIILELLPKGDLRNHLFSLRNKQEEGDEHTLLSFCRQIAAGMSYLASKSFVHRDLAARNILVSEDGICKIADFGMSRDLMDENYYISHGGKIPVKWTAPEALHFKKFSTASDVWSFGCVMYEIWSLGHKPFEGWSNNQTILEVDEGIRMTPPPGCPRAVYELAIQCWHPETSQRPSFTDIMQRFSLPDTKLLKWSEEDKTTDPEAATLGADLDAGLELFKDLQQRYLPKESNNDLSNSTQLGATLTPASLQTTTATTAATVLATAQATAVTIVTPATLQDSTLAVAAGAHSYEDPAFMTFFQEEMDKLNSKNLPVAQSNDGVPIVVAGAGGYSYEDADFVAALAEGNTDALSTNI